MSNFRPVGIFKNNQLEKGPFLQFGKIRLPPWAETWGKFFKFDMTQRKN